ncbi:hypothetical protein [Burkholderia alba]|uniref:hypothetical protein n=1 Tax=Burkholderia alba TaxID=2683677 RepID=UPI002B061557|nr:hypothetical protein [Burkholderia alba]
MTLLDQFEQDGFDVREGKAHAAGDLKRLVADQGLHGAEQVGGETGRNSHARDGIGDEGRGR